MPGRKKDEVAEVFDYDEAYCALTETMTNLHLSRMDEMPRIELYRDQVISIVSTELAPLFMGSESIITGSMVNNYVKQQVIPAPIRKRYTQAHIAQLIFVCVLKQVLPIAEVVQLTVLCREQGIDQDRAYDELVRCLEADLRALFGNDLQEEERKVSVPQLIDMDGKPVEGMLPTLLQAAIGLVANKVYLERLLELEERRAKSEEV